MPNFYGADQVRPGTPVCDLETPCLVVDLDAMERNIARMERFAQAASVRWRPHAKLHKCAELAMQLIAAGARGCCVQKLAEAEAMAAGGVCDIYISNEVVDERKLQRLAQLAWHLRAVGGRLAVAVDSLVGVQRLAQAMQQSWASQPQSQQQPAPSGAIDVLIEIDVGQHRAGVVIGADGGHHAADAADSALLALVQAIAQQPLLRWMGLHAYHGGAQHIEQAQARAEAMAGAYAQLRQALAQLARAGQQPRVVTGAGTGTFALEAASGLYTEIQPGSFLFMDAHYARVAPTPGQPVFEHALFVKTQVTACAGDHVVVDAGHKSHAIDSGLPLVWHGGQEPIYQFANGGDEHGIVTLRDAPATNAQLPALGQTLWLVPGHCDPTVNLHDVLIGVRGGLQEGQVHSVLRVDARGALW